jgi:hypothetical protein
LITGSRSGDHVLRPLREPVREESVSFTSDIVEVVFALLELTVKRGGEVGLDRQVREGSIPAVVPLLWWARSAFSMKFIRVAR